VIEATSCAPGVLQDEASNCVEAGRSIFGQADQPRMTVVSLALGERCPDTRTRAGGGGGGAHAQRGPWGTNPPRCFAAWGHRVWRGSKSRLVKAFLLFAKRAWRTWPGP
jgi:hypothetical protein